MNFGFQPILQHAMEEPTETADGWQSHDHRVIGAGHLDVRPTRGVVLQARRAEGEGGYRL